MRRIRLIIRGLILFAAVYLLATTADICLYSVKDEKCSADAAIILGAATTDSGVSPVYRERINHGIWLYKNGYVKAIITTGGVGAGNLKSDALIAKEYALSQGIPESAVYMEDQSRITQENIRNAKEIMENLSFDSAILVSDPLHMKRSMVMANDYGINAYSSPTPTSMYQSLKTKIPFLLREEFFYVGYRIYRLFN